MYSTDQVSENWQLRTPKDLLSIGRQNHQLSRPCQLEPLLQYQGENVGHVEVSQLSKGSVKIQFA